MKQLISTAMTWSIVQRATFPEVATWEIAGWGWLRQPGEGVWGMDRVPIRNITVIAGLKQSYHFLAVGRMTAENPLNACAVQTFLLYFQIKPTDCFDGFKQCFPNFGLQKWWARLFKPDTPNRMDLSLHLTDSVDQFRTLPFFEALNQIAKCWRLRMYTWVSTTGIPTPQIQRS